MKDYSESIEKIDAVRKDIVNLFIENEVAPNEALSLLSGLLVHIYYDVVENNSRDNFTEVMTQCYDAFTLITEESEGSVH